MLSINNLSKLMCVVLPTYIISYIAFQFIFQISGIDKGNIIHNLAVCMLCIELIQEFAVIVKL